MKTESEISIKIHDLQQIMDLKTRVHNRLDQISMLSGEGNKLREEINQLMGKIKALKWTLDMMNMIKLD